MKKMSMKIKKRAMKKRAMKKCAMKAKKRAAKQTRAVTIAGIAGVAAHMSPEKAYNWMARLTEKTPLDVQEAIEPKLQAAAVTAYSELLQELVLIFGLATK